jgi:hypothetical protein
MATMTETPEATTTRAPSHEYHAEAHVLSGHLKRPIEQKIELQAPVTLNDRRGGHLTRSVNDFSLEGLISFTKGETRVSGARSVKTNGWVTLCTSILEGLNVLEIISADRIVSQVSTEHAYENGHVPSVTFLGSQFKNFKVGGFPVTLNLNVGFLGDVPEGGRSYLQDPNFLEKVRQQTARIAGSRGLPKALQEQYDERLTYVQQLISICDEGDNGARKPITCSLVESIGEIPIPGVKSFGNVLVIPEFGSVALGEVEVGENMYQGNERPCVYFDLKSVKMKMGCVADGEAAAGSAKTNGQSYP